MGGSLQSTPERVWLKKYGQGVPPTIEIPNLLLPDLIEASVRRYPDRIALVYYGATWTYRRFWEASGRLAAALARDGIGPGDRVAIYLPNGPLYPIAVFAVLRLGAIVVQVSPLYLGQDLTRILRDSEPKALITLEILYPNVAQVRSEYAPPIVVVGRLREFYPFPKSLFVNSVVQRQKMSTAFPRDPWVRSWHDILRAPGTPPPWTGDPATTVAILQYTGGTTGRPKAAMLTHRNLVANVTQSNSWNTTRRPGEEIIMASIPFFHIYGLTVAMLMGFADGATIIIQTRPEIRELLRLIDRYRPTQFPGVPALYQAFNQQPDLAKYRIRSIRYCLSGSAPLPLEVAKRFEVLTGAIIVEGYGLSETSPVTHVNPVEGERRAGSIGIPLPNTDERVVALDDPGRVLGTEEVGELAVRGPQVMLGYYHQPEETALFLSDGWFRTGDVARIDADGYAYIVDRKKDMINVGGMKVYPREVEEVLFQHPGVADVACVGVPDLEHGEVVKAFVVKKSGVPVTEDELREFVRARIAHFKAPRSVEFRDALPRTGVQKVLRRVLREQAAAEAAVAPPPSVTGPSK
ncbi:MAG TPA: long-chain fatty acid--CoA ligase [Thermoplasmata archaeon]|nr:long-chain fatty acid--CoA ligase [Thermoplasmata archaeon]